MGKAFVAPFASKKQSKANINGSLSASSKIQHRPKYLTSPVQFETVSKETRDILLDRFQKELVPLLDQRFRQRKDPTKNELCKTTESSCREASILFGVNQVTRHIRRMRVVVFATNPTLHKALKHTASTANQSTSDSNAMAPVHGFGQIPVLCRLFGVPICALHMSSQQLGEVFGLQSVSVLGLLDTSKPTDQNDKEENGKQPPGIEGTQQHHQENQQVREAEEIKARFDSICEYIVSQCSHRVRK